MKILNAGVVPNHSVPFTGLNYCSPQLYRDLHERIENALQEKRNIEEDLAQHEARTNPSLREILERNLNKNEEILAKFVRQFSLTILENCLALKTQQDDYAKRLMLLSSVPHACVRCSNQNHSNHPQI